MTSSYKFKIGNLVVSRKGNTFAILNRGKIPDSGVGIAGYEVINLNSKARYWTSRTEAHYRWTLTDDKIHEAIVVLYGK